MTTTNNLTGFNASQGANSTGRAGSASRTPEAALADAKQSLANGTITAQMMTDMENGLYTAQELFGENTMWQVEFEIPETLNVGSHNHFIYIPENGPAQIISGHAHPSGQLYAENGDLLDSSHRPGGFGGDSHSVQQVPLADPAAAWEAMSSTAEDINAAGLYYHGLNQNSNSVAATMASVGGFTMGDPAGNAIEWLGFANPDAVGAGNNLMGELNGTEQPEQFVLMPGKPIDFQPDLSDPSTGSPMSEINEEQEKPQILPDDFIDPSEVRPELWPSSPGIFPPGALPGKPEILPGIYPQPDFTLPGELPPGLFPQPGFPLPGELPPGLYPQPGFPPPGEFPPGLYPQPGFPLPGEFPHPPGEFPPGEFPPGFPSTPVDTLPTWPDDLWPTPDVPSWPDDNGKPVDFPGTLYAKAEE